MALLPAADASQMQPLEGSLIPLQNRTFRPSGRLLALARRAGYGKFDWRARCLQLLQ